MPIWTIDPRLYETRPKTPLPVKDRPEPWHCAWAGCEGAFTQQPGPGRARRYCKKRCREQAYRERKRAARIRRN